MVHGRHNPESLDVAGRCFADSVESVGFEVPQEFTHSRTLLELSRCWLQKDRLHLRPTRLETDCKHVIDISGGDRDHQLVALVCRAAMHLVRHLPMRRPARKRVCQNVIRVVPVVEWRVHVDDHIALHNHWARGVLSERAVQKLRCLLDGHTATGDEDTVPGVISWSLDTESLCFYLAEQPKYAVCTLVHHDLHKGTDQVSQAKLDFGSC